ncbi:MAG TPA: hypothetical protein H9890_02890 [Candidatus Faecalibacterium intestinigallinarum]|uniref:Uncharacterized protein n=1 Tax=Candidatus Faecalibacterium intestinigallinarum TaxID=2838581 RepID=A0A9D1Q810_9FIRM|nr:hypothetical protein [Candidatus Faecalibacterium intestinigallinarum]
MKDTIRYPDHFAPVAEEEMVYLNGGSLSDTVDNVVDSASSALNVLGIVATVVGVCVLGSSYVWGIRQANAWLDDNGDGNIFTILGKAVDDLGADMSKSLSHFTRDLVAAVTVVGLWPLSIPLLILS